MTRSEDISKRKRGNKHTSFVAQAMANPPDHALKRHGLRRVFIVSNFHLLMGEGDAEMAPLETWDLPSASPRSAVELVRGLEATWQMIHTALGSFTPADLDDVFVEVQNEQASRFTRQGIIWSTIKHDLHHGGEISFTLGAHHGEVPDL